MDISAQALRDFRQGNLETFYTENYPSLLRYAQRVLGQECAHQAEDCIQEAVYKVYRQRKQFSSPIAMKAYVFTCVHNEIVSVRRRSDSHQRYLQEPQDELLEDSLTDQLVLQETLDKLYAAIDSLPDDLHQLFDLSFEQGLQNVEIARMLSLSPETIKKRKARMIDLLRQQLCHDSATLLLLSLLTLD